MRLITKYLVKIPKRKESARKGDSGKVLIIGGSKEYVGAVTLAGLAALRSGVDWVSIAAPEKAAYSINSLSADLITYKLKGGYFSVRHVDEISRLCKSFDCVLLGNGISLSSAEFVRNIIKKIDKPIVVDADAIKVLSADSLKNSIITPHLGELELFLRNSRIKINTIKSLLDNIKSLRDFNMHNNYGNKKRYKSTKVIKLLEANAIILQGLLINYLRNGNILLLKGPIDLIITNDLIYYNKTGNPGMAKAGTGDVLAGIVVGFLAQTKDLLQSAVNATYFNGLIGDILLKRHKGYTYLASDMVEEIKKLI